MANRSSVVNCDLQINDLEGLKKYIDEGKKGNNFFITMIGKENQEVVSPLETYFFEDKICQINEENMTLYLDVDDWKIVGYWHNDLVAWLQQLALFVEGTLELDCGSEEFAKIEFSESELEIQEGSVQWENLPFEHIKLSEPLQKLKDTNELIEKI